MKKDSTINDAINLLERESTGLLITFAEENQIDSRLVGPYVHDGLNLYIFTSKNSNKIKQIEKKPICFNVHSKQI
jgi:general stress protein 26